MLEPNTTSVTVRIDRESAEIVNEYMRVEEVSHLSKAVSDIIKEWYAYMGENRLI